MPRVKGKYVDLIMVINYKAKAFKSIFRDTFISKLKFKGNITTWISTAHNPKSLTLIPFKDLGN